MSVAPPATIAVLPSSPRITPPRFQTNAIGPLSKSRPVEPIRFVQALSALRRKGPKKQSAKLGNGFREAVQPFARPVGLDQVVVAYPRQRVATNVGRVHDDVHVFRDRHRLVAANERPFDQVIALAMTVEAFFLGPIILPHEIVIGRENILAGYSGLEQFETELARFQCERELVLE